jgi:hypothetical protein
MPRPGALVLTILFLFFAGVHTMSAATEPLRLSWQWNRPSSHTVLVVVDSIAAESGGLFGVLRSPSLADALPDAQVLNGHILAADADPVGRPVVLRIPKHELPALAPGQHVAIGYTDDAAAVRIAAVPPNLSTEAEAVWFKTWATTR